LSSCVELHIAAFVNNKGMGSHLPAEHKEAVVAADLTSARWLAVTGGGLIKMLLPRKT
jgi:hypothetical protein